MKLFIVILTGLSGSGKTVALRALEDCGFFCTDNLPPPLIDDFIKTSTESGVSTIAIGIDIREKKFLSGIQDTLRNLKEVYSPEIVFIEAEKDTLIRRFKETRRPHPLGVHYDFDIIKAIDGEASILRPLRDLADRVIDTTAYSPHHLRDTITSIFCDAQRKKMNIVLTSFGYKFGVPRNADLIFDVRFIANPHFIPALRELTGLDKPVEDFISDDTNSGIFLDKVKEMFEFLIPLYIKEGKAYLNICIGCTGGRHRSVNIVEELSDYMNTFPVNVKVIHRDL